MRLAAGALAAAGALCACGAAPGVLPTGGYGRSTFLLWQEPGREPLLMQTQKFHQEDELFQRMHFDDVLVRCPSADGVVYLRAEDAEVHADTGVSGAAQPAAGGPGSGGHSAAVLASDADGDLGGGNADEEADARTDLATLFSHHGYGVHFAGSDRGLPVVGVATLVRLRPVDHAVICEHLTVSTGAGSPALAGALAVLPHPLVLPEIRADQAPLATPARSGR